jgi:DNA-binding transcriptional MerR regulator
MDNKLFTNKQIAKATGLTDRAVLFYNSLVPAIEGTGTGRGNARQYDRQALFKFLIIKQLADYGITVGKMEQILELAVWDKISKYLADGYHPENTEDEQIASPNPDHRHVHLRISRYIDGQSYGQVEYFGAEAYYIGVTQYSISIDLNKCASFITINLDLLYRQATAA